MKKILLMISAAAMIFAVGCSDEDPIYNVNLSNDIKAKVDGYVFKGTGAVDSALKDVTVTISGKTAKTNAIGYFAIEGLAPGEYIVKYEKEGYSTIMNTASIAATDYYGDAKQTFTTQVLYPKVLNLVVQYRQIDPDWVIGDDAEDRWISPAGAFNVEIEYTNDEYFDDIPDMVASGGAITLSNIPELGLKLNVDQLIGDVKYTSSIELTQADVKKGTIKVEVKVQEDYEAPFIDILD
ncbi:MAG: carboxypeptidase regulatory-like domain-containing protein [Bacteroidales bacterium]|nr:carboxypeptidase regulatory-like domain-containing protein [Bacteroidales bacterium]